MDQEKLADAALVLFGHGSTANAESAAPVYRQAAELRRRSCFAEVREAFWKQEPRLIEVVAGLATPRVFLLPLFISEGFFSETVIPEALGFRQPGQATYDRMQRRGNQTLFYCKPIGTHESMTGVLLAQARAVVEKAPFPRAPQPKEITLFIAGHGTPRNENSRKAIEMQVARLTTRGVYAAVHAVFLEEEPRIGSCFAMAQTRNVVVLPFFISEGEHAQEDIPLLLGEPERIVQQRLSSGLPPWRNPTERQGKLVWYSASVGSEPQIAEVILDRVKEIYRG
ncbi:Cobalamin (Vitamin B12) biosynthesis CbiX protein [Verrucomicrobia bacterium]|nr:Cobalamin (Vitamin B12) biosynthesis CbiX protein [Verrucomicrobiota bacterium]